MRCYAKGCRKQFTVKVGTVFGDAHIPAAQDAAGAVCQEPSRFVGDLQRPVQLMGERGSFHVDGTTT
jgi:hypothetical protein